MENGGSELRWDVLFPQTKHKPSRPYVTIQLVAGQPIWAKLFYLVRTGHPQEAIDEAIRYQQAIDHREPSFLANFRTWLESPDRK
jgi:hypothetical protein